MSATAKPEVISSRLFTVIFESWDACWVIADSAEEAIAKVKIVFPKQVIESVLGERKNDRGGERKIIL